MAFNSGSVKQAKKSENLRIGVPSECIEGVIVHLVRRFIPALWHNLILFSDDKVINFETSKHPQGVKIASSPLFR